MATFQGGPFGGIILTILIKKFWKKLTDNTKTLKTFFEKKFIENFAYLFVKNWRVNFKKVAFEVALEKNDFFNLKRSAGPRGLEKKIKSNKILWGLKLKKFSKLEFLQIIPFRVKMIFFAEIKIRRFNGCPSWIFKKMLFYLNKYC